MYGVRSTPYPSLPSQATCTNVQSGLLLVLGRVSDTDAIENTNRISRFPTQSTFAHVCTSHYSDRTEIRCAHLIPLLL